MYIPKTSINNTFFKAILLAFFTVVGALYFSQSVGALTSDPKMFISGDNSFYVYAKAGEKVSASFTKSEQRELTDIPAETVVVTLEGPDSAKQSCTLDKAIAAGVSCGFKNVTSQKSGVWRVNFSLPSTAKLYGQVSPTVHWGANHFSWNISVSDDTGEKSGRIWTEQYAIRQPIQPEYLTDLTYYYVSEDGYIYKATYKGYNGQISSLSADGVGIREGKQCISSYQSVSVNDQKLSPSFGQCGASYKLFFEAPAGELPESARTWDDTTTWVRPSISRPVVEGLKYTPTNSSDQQSGTIEFALKNFIGQYEVKIDVDGDGNYDSSQDVKIKHSLKKLSTDTQKIEFDGIDTDGQVIPRSQKIGIRVSIAKLAEIHLVSADVEGRTGGIELVRLSGDNAPTYGICWNDTKLPAIDNVALSTKLLDGRGCASSQGGVHGWAYDTGSWGDLRYIDDWTNASAKVEGVSTISYPETDDAAEISAPIKRNAGFIAFGIAAIAAVVAVAIVIKIIHHRRVMKQFEPPKPKL